jgi:hypothetical protein
VESISADPFLPRRLSHFWGTPRPIRQKLSKELASAAFSIVKRFGRKGWPLRDGAFGLLQLQKTLNVLLKKGVDS